MHTCLIEIEEHGREGMNAHLRFQKEHGMQSMPDQHRKKKRTEVSIADDAANDNVSHRSAYYPFLIGQFSAVLLEEHVAHCGTVSRQCVAQYALQVKLAMKLCFSNARAVQQIENKTKPPPCGTPLYGTEQRANTSQRLGREKHGQRPTNRAPSKSIDSTSA